MVCSIHTELCSLYYSLFQNVFIISKRNLVPFSYHSPVTSSPSPKQSLIYFLFLYYSVHFIWMESYNLWSLVTVFLSFSIKFSQFTYAISWISISFSLLNSIPFHGIPHFAYLPFTSCQAFTCLHFLHPYHLLSLCSVLWTWGEGPKCDCAD